MGTDSLELSGRHALVTGAGSGIGLATARVLMRYGAKVAAVVQTQEQAQQLAATLPQAPCTVDSWCMRNGWNHTSTLYDQQHA